MAETYVPVKRWRSKKDRLADKEAEQDVIDDSLIYVIQALRQIEMYSDLSDTETASITDLVSRLDETHKVTILVLDYLRQKLNAPV